MKVYLFYRVIPKLDPYFYGWTSDKGVAKAFHKFRKGFAKVVKEIETDRIHEEIEVLEKYEIILYLCKTAIGGEVGKVPFPMTLREAMNIELHSKELFMAKLAEVRWIPINIFSKKMQEILHNILYDDPLLDELQDTLCVPEIWMYPDYPGSFDFWNDVPEVDILFLFLMINEDTVNMDAILSNYKE